MKRLTIIAAALLTLAAAPFALAAAGPGKFETKITGQGAKTEQGTLDGTWTVDLASPTSGPLKLTWNGHLKGGGRYVISGSTITLTPKQGGACASKGRYALKLSGKRLTFKLIKDTCATRRDVLTYGSWTMLG